MPVTNHSISTKTVSSHLMTAVNWKITASLQLVMAMTQTTDLTGLFATRGEPAGASKVISESE